MDKKDTTLVFLDKVSHRVGPVNAVSLLKDAHIVAFKKLFSEAGITEDRIQRVIDEALEKTAQDILNIPVQSPYQQ